MEVGGRGGQRLAARCCVGQRLAARCCGGQRSAARCCGGQVSGAARAEGQLLRWSAISDGQRSTSDAKVASLRSLGASSATASAIWRRARHCRSCSRGRRGSSSERKESKKEGMTLHSAEDDALEGENSAPGNGRRKGQRGEVDASVRVSGAVCEARKEGKSRSATAENEGRKSARAREREGERVERRGSL